jgi:hypothetical protein
MSRTVLLTLILCWQVTSGCHTRDSSSREIVADLPAELVWVDGGTEVAAADVVVAEATVSRPSFVAVTFNTGTGGTAPIEGNFGYNKEQAFFNDEYYGNGIAWGPFVQMTHDWFVQVDPDVVVFQEIFWPGDCADIPLEAHVGFVCEGWQEGDQTVMERLLGSDYQYMCNLGHPDKCAAVHQRFGSFRGCDTAVCLEGMAGSQIEGCGHGARIGRATIDLVGGGTLTLVNIHGSSGFTEEDFGCRVKQFEQVFVDLGDGAPGVNGSVNLALGDLNTDPGRLADSDASAARFNDFVGDGKAFRYLTEVGMDAPPTYGVLNIDHVVSDRLTGSCWHPTVDAGHGPVMDAFFFDHLPAVCSLSWEKSSVRDP